MTTPDIAGLCEELRESATQVFGHYAGEPEDTLCLAPIAKITQAADTLERQAAEIERLRELLRCIRDTPANEFDAVDVANRVRAALTGEDAPGSSTNQNTEPGLAFSAPVELSGNPGEPKPLMTAQELADHASDAFDDALPDDALPHEVGRAWKAVGERLAAILAERAAE